MRVPLERRIRCLGHERYDDTWMESWNPEPASDDEEGWERYNERLDHQPDVAGLSPFDYTPDEVERWPPDVRGRLECVSMSVSACYELDEFVRMLQLLPALRRIRWESGGLTTEDFAAAVRAVKQHGAITSWYIANDSSEIDDWSGLRSLQSQLVEFVFVAEPGRLQSQDDCKLGHGGTVFSGSDWETRLTEAVAQLLPRANVRICSAYSFAEGFDVVEPTARHLLPAVLEPWQPGSLGPLHNAVESEALARLCGDLSIDGKLSALLSQMRVSGAQAEAAEVGDPAL